MAALLNHPNVRRLRVQVLLWTILPVLLFLIGFSFTGSGSHEQSMRMLVADENLRLAGAIASELAARLEHYSFYLELAAATPSLTHPAPEGMELYRIENGAPRPAALPKWATAALARTSSGAAAVGTPQPIVDPANQRIVWTLPLPSAGGWLVAAVPLSALAPKPEMVAPHPHAVTTASIVDAAGQVIYQSGAPPASDQPLTWTGITDALAGQRGVVITDGGGHDDVVAYAPIQGAAWALTIREPLQELTAPLFHFESLLPLILASGALLSFLTLYFGLRYIARPLQKLADQATGIGNGDFDAADTPIGGLVEIEDVRLAVNAMAHRIQASQAAMHDYIHAVTSVQEEERARLSRDLHDETIQALMALDHKAQMAQRDLERDQARCREQLLDLRHMIGAATQEVRRFSQALRPPYLDDLGLAPALDALAHEVGAEQRVDGEPRRIGEDKELALYRMTQEALNNARNHAQARQIRVLLYFGHKGVTLAVRDDGVGFRRPEKFTDLARAGHLGLMGMKERADLIGADLIIDSQPGGGTTILIQAPDDERQPLDKAEWEQNGRQAWLTGPRASGQSAPNDHAAQPNPGH